MDICNRDVVLKSSRARGVDACFLYKPYIDINTGPEGSKSKASGKTPKCLVVQRPLHPQSLKVTARSTAGRIEDAKPSNQNYWKGGVLHSVILFR
jgi:hypothetical protein